MAQTAWFGITFFGLLWLGLTLLFVWLIGFAELSYLGTKGVKLLYNFFSFIYDLKWVQDKYSSQALTQKLFLSDLKTVLKDNAEAKMLDLACGTGRMSLMVLEQSWFKGQIQAIDFSEGMLGQLKNKLKKFTPAKQEQLKAFCKDLTAWQTPQINHYNAVTLMEAGEFLPNFVQLTAQIAEVLKPGGLFLCTKPPDWMAWLYFGREQTSDKLTQLLQQNGFQNISISSWTARYQVVKAYKSNIS
jgi:ubiquinone/menaquinone biosynthesis C-methylase UbiE